MSKSLSPASDRHELALRIAFAHTRNICLRTARRFAALGIEPADFFSLDCTTLARRSGLRNDIFDDSRRRASLEAAYAEVDFIASCGAHAIYYTDDDYPKRLLQCDDAPALLYALGDSLPDTRHVVAIVGTRHCTPHGQKATERLVQDLASKLDSLTIVSGLAYGVDIAAHRAAVAAGVPTGAFVAHGLNTIYPPEHRNDARRMISAGGFIITEYSSRDRIHRGNFLARNRLIAGSADATIIIESDLKGGAMTTARLASGYNREVLALPGRIFDTYSRGCNHLLATNAAAIVRDADDVLRACCWNPVEKEGKQQSLAIDIPPEQQQIIDYIVLHPDHTVNDMAVNLGLSITQLTSILFEMEMENLVTAMPGNRYGTLQQ